MRVVLLAYPRMTQLDLTGPLEVFGRTPQMERVIVARTLEPVTDAIGLRLLPDANFADCPQADILFVSGGPGQVALMEDRPTLDFLRAQAAGAKWITSVCTGSLLLGAAGLLDGYRATCHWLSLPQLALFGAVPVAERVVTDRDRMTGAGVTSGIDFALTLLATLYGEDVARAAQLTMEYDPAPPFGDGSPARADPALVARVRAGAAAMMEEREAVTQRAAEALRRPS